jgi:hypothetical protein
MKLSRLPYSSLMYIFNYKHDSKTFTGQNEEVVQTTAKETVSSMLIKSNMGVCERPILMHVSLII